MPKTFVIALFLFACSLFSSPHLVFAEDLYTKEYTNRAISPPVADTLILSEVFVSSSAFVEIQNPYNEFVSTKGWQVWQRDTEKALPETLLPNEYVVIDLFPTNTYMRAPFDDEVYQIPFLGSAKNSSDTKGSYIYNVQQEEFVHTLEPTRGSVNIWKIDNHEKHTLPTSSHESVVQFDHHVSSGIYISELFANPDGVDSEQEYIELYNTHRNEVSLVGWQIQDESGKNFDLDTQSILGEAYLTLPFSVSGVSLNNSEEKIYLLYEDTVIQEIAYTAAPSGKSYAQLATGEWEWQESTPGKPPTVIIGEVMVAISPQEDGSSSTLVEEILPNDMLIDNIYINEVYSNPNDGEEFIELYYAGDNIVTSSIILDDVPGGSSVFYSDPTLFIPKTYYTYPLSVTRIQINNGGDTIELSNSAEHLLDRVEVPALSKGESYARTVDGDWHIVSFSTPGLANKFLTTSDVELPTVSTTQPNQFESTSSFMYELRDIEFLSKGDMITTTATVVALPGTIGAQYFHVIDKTKTYVTTIYQQGKDFPNIAIGDVIQISGKVSETKAGKRINISGQEGVKILGHDSTIVDILDNKSIRSVKGMVTHQRSQELEVEGDGGELNVIRVKAAIGQFPDNIEGKFIESIVIVDLTNDDSIGYIRRLEDFFILDQTKTTSTSSTTIPLPLASAQTQEIMAQKNDKQFSVSHLLSILFIVSAIGFVLVRKNKEKIWAALLRIKEIFHKRTHQSFTT